MYKTHAGQYHPLVGVSCIVDHLSVPGHATRNERTMVSEELRDVMGRPDPLALESVPKVLEELVRFSACSCDVPSCLPFLE